MSDAVTDQPSRRIKLKLKTSTQANVIEVPERQGSDDELEEPDPAFEEHFLLRVPEEVAEWVGGMVKRREEWGDTFKIDMKDSRRGTAQIKGKQYDVKLVDMPTIMESQKTIDRKQLYKVADISQVLIIEEPGQSHPTPSSTPFHHRLFQPDEFVWPHGLTPPLKHVRKRRFRKRVSKKAVEVVEREVERLLQEDALAQDVQYEVQEAQFGHLSDSEVGTPHAQRMMDIDDMEGGRTPFRDGEGDEGEDEGEEEDDSDDDLAAAIDRGLEELEEEDEDDDEDDSDEEEEEEDNEEENEGGEGNKEGATDEDKELMQQKRLLTEEVRDLERTIELKKADLQTAPNAIMVKRFEDVVRKLNMELEMKKSQLSELTTAKTNEHQDDEDDEEE